MRLLQTGLTLILGILLIPQQTHALILESPAFKHNESIPVKYTCDGSDISPSLKWSDIPERTKSFVLIVDDPDARSGTWDHWVLFNIPAKTTQLQENIKTLPNGTIEGRNSWQVKNYKGPCPPDTEHRYVFKLYALDNELTLSEGVSTDEIISKMNSHVIGKTELVGRYERKKE